MEGIITCLIFVIVLSITFYKTEISLAILLNINIFRALPYVDYKAPRYGYYNDSDLILGAILPILCFIIIFLKIMWRKNKINYKVDVYDFLLLVLTFIMLISIIVSPSVKESIYYSGIFILLGLPFFFISKLFFSNKKDVSKSLILFIKSILLFALLFSLLSLYFHKIAKYPYERMTFPGVYPIFFCLFLCMSLIFIISFYFNPTFKKLIRKKGSYLFSIPVLLIIILAIIKTNTRGPVAALILSIFTVLLAFSKMKINLKIIRNFFFFLFSGLVLITTFFDLNKIASRFINLTTADSNSITPRFTAYLDSFYILLTKPWGISVGTFYKFYSGNDVGGDSYAHNLFMELISSFGVLGVLLSGLIIYILIVEYNFLVKNVKIILKTPLYLTSILLFLFFFYETQFSFTLNTHKGFYFSMALYSVVKYKLLKELKNEI